MKDSYIEESTIADLSKNIIESIRKFILYEVNKTLEQRLEQRVAVTLSRDEVCSILNISNPTLLKWCKSGVIKYLKIGRNVRFYRKDVEDFLDSKGGMTKNQITKSELNKEVQQ